MKNAAAGRFSGRYVYITGGSRGIGQAVAEEMAAAGAHVLIFARNEERLCLAAGGIAAARRETAQQVAWCSLDVTDPAAVTRVVSEQADRFGAPEILINSAGGAWPDYFGNISAEQFERSFRLNVFGTRHMIAAALPFLPRPGGHIVNVASVAGLIGVFGYTDYCAAKFAVLGFSEALRAELAPEGVMVSVLCPPDTDTPGLAAENRTKPPETAAIAGNAGTLAPREVARVLLRGMRREKFLIIPGWNARLSVLAKRLVPGLVTRIMDRAVTGVPRQHNRQRRENP